MTDRNDTEEIPEEIPEDMIEESEEPIEGETIEAGSDTTEMSVDELLEELNAAKEEAGQNKELLLRKSADFENYKKRAEKEKIDHITFANEKLISEILCVVDNLERALHHTNSAEESTEGLDNLTKGVEMTLKSFYSVLEKFGLVPINAVGEKFDPTMHEALQEEDNEDFETGFVTKELQKGFNLNERLLRPAVVVVAK